MAGRWLKGAEDDQPEQAVTLETEEALRATESGQVALLEGETVFSLNRKRVEQARSGRAGFTSRADLERYLGEIGRRVRLLTATAPRQGSPAVRPYGRISRSGYRIEKLIYESEPGILIPALLFAPEPAGGRAPAVLYVHGRGKSAAAGPGGDLEQLVKAGLVVLALDLRGFGETQHAGTDQGSDFPRYFGDYGSAMKALLLGKPLLGMRMADIARGLDLLATRPEVDATRIYGFGRDVGAVALLHAAAVDPRLRRLALEGMLLSYESVAASQVHRGVFENVVPGVLRSYDLPDLAAALAPRPIWIMNPANPLGQRAASTEARRVYGRSLEAFRLLGAAESIRVGEREADQPVANAYPGFLAP